MGKVLFHTYLPLMLAEKGFVRNFQKTSPFIHLIVQRESHDGPSEQVWSYILEIKGIQLRTNQGMAAEEGGGREGRTDSPGTI